LRTLAGRVGAWRKELVNVSTLGTFPIILGLRRRDSELKVVEWQLEVTGGIEKAC
jgi:hypothetical protein